MPEVVHASAKPTTPESPCKDLVPERCAVRYMRSRWDQFDGLECKMRPAADERSGVVLNDPPRQSARLQQVVPRGLTDGVCESLGLDDPNHDKCFFFKS